MATVLLAAGFYGAKALLWRDVAPVPAQILAAQASAEASSQAAASGGLVEVPSVCGLRADEALVILKTAGLQVAFEATGVAVSRAESRTVRAQNPVGGVVTAGSTVVTLVCPSLVASSAISASPAVRKPGSGFVVCIDPGHQAHANTKLEPVGPGSKVLKPRMTAGLSGVESALAEYELALQLSMNLKRRLEASGVKVVMTRTTNDVDITNVQRAALANKSHADLFIRVHANASTDSSASGVAVVYPGKNAWTKKVWTRSLRAAGAVEAAVCRTSGAVNAGVTAAQGFSGFNWAKMPAIMVEAGFLSNPVEDRLLGSPLYQDKLASGMSEGILAYLRKEAR